MKKIEMMHWKRTRDSVRKDVQGEKGKENDPIIL